MNRRDALQKAAALASAANPTMTSFMSASAASIGASGAASIGAASIAAPATAAAAPAAQPLRRDWPARALRMVVPYPPGGSPDTMARIVCDPLAKVLGQAVVIDNRQGIGALAGAAEAAQAPGDGYTFLYTIQGPLVTAPLLYKSLPYDPIQNFAPVTLVATSPNVLVVTPGVGAATLPDFVRIVRERAADRKAPLRYGSVGEGSAGHLAMELFKSRAGLEMTHVSFRSLPDVVDAMLTGSVEASIMVPAIAVGPAHAGKLKALGITTLGRVASLPDMPTFAEQGYPGLEAIAWQAIVAPADTPRAIVDRMSTELVRIIKSDDVRASFLALYFSCAGTAPEALAGLMQTERNRWAKVIREAHVKVE